ncbi:peptidoglycan DD-metalloendopeptidase family protein [Patescibacteria group bacterium]
MKLKIKRFFIKFALFILKGSGKSKGPLLFVFRYFKKPLFIVGGILYGASFFIYKIYFYFKRQFTKLVPSKDILGLSTNKYLVHAAIVIVALATATQNLYAHSGSLGDYGKKSILFELTQPVDEEEVVEGLPIHSDIEGEMNGDAFVGVEGIVEGQAIAQRDLGFVGADYTPDLDTQSTRTSTEYYVVQKGDTLGGIAQEFGISLNTLLWANQLTSRSYIRPGDKLTILPISGVAHTVKKNETLAGIVKKYSADQEKVMEFNHLADAKSLQIGQVLVIPDGRIIYVAPVRTYSSGYSGKSYASSGKLQWPAPSKRITQYYNWRHPAIDIGLKSGSRIIACEDGKIMYSGWGRGYGYEILIDHGNGIKTRYAHNSRLYVKAGQIVSRGETIALSGNTGWSTGPHLHLEVYVNGVRRNPLLYIK